MQELVPRASFTSVGTDLASSASHEFRCTQEMTFAHTSRNACTHTKKQKLPFFFVVTRLWLISFSVFFFFVIVWKARASPTHSFLLKYSHFLSLFVYSLHPVFCSKCRDRSQNSYC